MEKMLLIAVIFISNMNVFFANNGDSTSTENCKETTVNGFNAQLETIKELQKEFPELEVRSSILMDTKTATDVYNVVTSGFNSVCIDRALMRDHDTIKTIAKIKAMGRLRPAVM